MSEPLIDWHARGLDWALADAFTTDGAEWSVGDVARAYLTTDERERLVCRAIRKTRKSGYWLVAQENT